MYKIENFPHKLHDLICISGCFYLLYLFSPNDNTEEENQVTKEVEFIVKNAELLGSSKNGDFSYKIFSKKAKANDLNNQIFLEQVKAYIH